MRVGILYPNPTPLSPTNWSGTPTGLAGGFRSNGCDIVALGTRFRFAERKVLGLTARLSREQPTVAHRQPYWLKATTAALSRSIAVSGRLDLIVAMGTECYTLDGLRSGEARVVTYDDGTFAQMWQNSESDIRNRCFPSSAVRDWIARQKASSLAASHCFVSTSWAAGSFVDDYGVPHDRVHVVGMGHRSRELSGFPGRDWGTPRFLFVGIDWRRKNGEAVLRAFRRLRETIPNARLTIVGEHPSIDEEGVVGVGLLARDDLQAQRKLDSLFAESTAFVLPSRFDPSPIAYLEAGSAGLPVIATTEGGAAELLGDGAIAIHPDDDAGLLEAMRHLSLPEVCEAKGKEAALRASASTWTHVAKRIEEACLVGGSA